jgi:NitT/TauT family transport system permease protein
VTTSSLNSEADDLAIAAAASPASHLTAAETGSVSAAPVRRGAGAVLRKVAHGWLPPIGVAAVLIGIWYYVADVGLSQDERFLLPPPHQIFTQGFGNAVIRSEIFSALWVTTEESMIGLIVAVGIGTVLAVLMAQANWIRSSFYPWIVILQTIPTLAMIPVIGFWFGYSLTPRVIICVIITMFPLVINPLQGMLGASRGLHDLMTLGGAGRLKRLVYLQIPSALPDFFTGLQTAAGLSVVGATVGDFFFGRGQIGLGLLINRYISRLESAPMLAVVFVTCVLGVLVFLVFGFLGRRVVGRWSEAWGAH